MFSLKRENPEKLCEQIWREHEAYIRKFCEYKLQSQKDLVDDCVNEVFLSLLETLKNNGITHFCLFPNNEIKEI